jgi:hypothetical protein
MKRERERERERDEFCKHMGKFCCHNCSRRDTIYTPLGAAYVAIT